MSRKLLPCLAVLIGSILAAACDPCPSCPRQIVVAAPTPTPTATATPTPSPTPTGFGPDSFKGNYSLRFAGKGATHGNPDAGVGILNSDGVSTVKGNLTENKDGTLCTFDLSGTYKVNSDGTARINLTAETTSPGCTSGMAPQASVLFNMGNGVAFVNTMGSIWLGSLIKQ